MITFYFEANYTDYCPIYIINTSYKSFKHIKERYFSQDQILEWTKKDRDFGLQTGVYEGEYCVFLWDRYMDFYNEPKHPLLHTTFMQMTLYEKKPIFMRIIRCA